jgi:SnoaL-like polyketide cyclase
MGRVEDGESIDYLGVVHCGGPGDGSAPVVTDQHRGLSPEFSDKTADVVGEQVGGCSRACPVRPPENPPPPGARSEAAGITLPKLDPDVRKQAGGAHEEPCPLTWMKCLTAITVQIVDLVAEDDTVVAHFKCSGTHQADWLGIGATQDRFEDVDEVYFFRVENGTLAGATGIEDNLSRMRQLGFRFDGPRT